MAGTQGRGFKYNIPNHQIGNIKMFRLQQMLCICQF